MHFYTLQMYNYTFSKTDFLTIYDKEILRYKYVRFRHAKRAPRLSWKALLYCKISAVVDS